MENFLQFLLLHFLKFPLKINVNQLLCRVANTMQNFKAGFDKKVFWKISLCILKSKNRWNSLFSKALTLIRYNKFQFVKHSTTFQNKPWSIFPHNICKQETEYTGEWSSKRSQHYFQITAKLKVLKILFATLSFHNSNA